MEKAVAGATAFELDIEWWVLRLLRTAPPSSFFRLAQFGNRRKTRANSQITLMLKSYPLGSAHYLERLRSTALSYGVHCTNTASHFYLCGLPPLAKWTA
jgi:hypothetical protein